MSDEVKTDEPIKLEVVKVGPWEGSGVPTTVEPEREGEQVVVDAALVRENLKAAIEIGKEALEDMHRIATQGGEAEQYEVVSSLLKTYILASKELLNVHRTKRALNVGKEDAKKVTNNLFVGSTAELQKLLED